MTASERTAATGSTGMPRMRTLAGELVNSPGRRHGKISAVIATIVTVTTPASTPIESSVKNEVESTDHPRMASTITEAVMIAGIGACVRSLTSESFAGSTRSKDQAKIERTGMNVFGNIAGRFQKRKLTATRTAKMPLLAERLAMRL